MSLGLPFLGRFRIVGDCDKSVAILPNIEDHISLHVVGVLERAANLWKILPSNLFDDSYRCTDFLRRIWIFFRSLVQMLARNDMHSSIVLHNP